MAEGDLLFSPENCCQPEKPDTTQGDAEKLHQNQQHPHHHHRSQPLNIIPKENCIRIQHKMRCKKMTRILANNKGRRWWIESRAGTAEKWDLNAVVRERGRFWVWVWIRVREALALRVALSHLTFLQFVQDNGIGIGFWPTNRVGGFTGGEMLEIAGLRCTCCSKDQSLFGRFSTAVCVCLLCVSYVCPLCVCINTSKLAKRLLCLSNWQRLAVLEVAKLFLQPGFARRKGAGAAAASAASLCTD